MAEETGVQEAAEGVDIRALDAAIDAAKSRPAEAWLVAGGDALVAALVRFAGDHAVTVTRVDEDGAVAIERGALVVSELSDDAHVRLLEEAARAGAFAVAVLPEPTIEAFRRAVHAGARDVLAGEPSPETLATRLVRWRERGRPRRRSSSHL